MNALRKFAAKSAVAVTAVSAPVLALAQAAPAAIDFTPITAAFTSSDIVSGILSIAGVLAVIYTAWRGAKIVLGMMRGG
ncbi:MAG: hypothetical protein V4695_07245 [Pseudomonadota bacterium]